ncbi:hypothetical protein EDB92DRAFT_1795429 [Lactarius akahatsu]|uniref:HNH nuclease domain-containing protein n=1 Tax=Lactarius akahatsu TaxID=416441 RepID=A0AAD4QF01_9AGAM|nr:hypothetical protein EDB92DRAFT_1795429 [Lactarius akahatsu]
MVNIYLNVDGSTFLSIPDSDVRRLSTRPFKWLRFVMFSICGTRGHLSMMPDGPAIDYNSTLLNGVIDLHYEPSGKVSFMDQLALSCRYIQRIVEDRSSCYYRRSLPAISGIDDTHNGVLLAKAVHSMLAHGEVAFLKTPNYGLDPTDIPRVDLGQVRKDHFTLQHLKEPREYNPGRSHRIRGHGKHAPNSLPHAIILDYMYGVAVYKQWGRKDSNVH